MCSSKCRHYILHTFKINDIKLISSAIIFAVEIDKESYQNIHGTRPNGCFVCIMQRKMYYVGLTMKTEMEKPMLAVKVSLLMQNFYQDFA